MDNKLGGNRLGNYEPRVFTVENEDKPNTGFPIITRSMISVDNVGNMCMFHDTALSMKSCKFMHHSTSYGTVGLVFADPTTEFALYQLDFLIPE